MRIAVVGARGQLGAAVVHTCAPAHEVIPLGRAEVDITDDAAVAQVLGDLRPDAIVNCAAYNDVDGAEDDPVDALKVNAFGVRALARAAEAASGILVHYSTDFVFDGTSSRPYTEEDRPNPKSTYAASKMLGEWFALDLLDRGEALSRPRSYVLRVESLFGGVPGAPVRGTVAGIHKALVTGQRPKAFVDRTVSPTYIPDAAIATRTLLESTPPPGLYHCVSTGQSTWFEFATELARIAGLEPRLEPVKMADVRLRAERPRFCALSNAKLASVGIVMPTWQDALARYLGKRPNL